MRIATSLAVVICAMIMAAQPLPAQRGPANVDVAKIVEREVASGQTFVGTVMPIKRSVIGSAVGGRVAEFPVNEGDFVRKGDLLVRLKPDIFKARIDELNAVLLTQKARLEQTRASLIQAEAAHLKNKELYEKDIISELNCIPKKRLLICEKRN